MRKMLPALPCLLGILPVAMLPNAIASIPTVDLSADTARQVVVAEGTETVYQGHPTTLLLPDGKTILCVWTIGHGGACGPMKRSEDGGRTWSALLPTRDSWTKARNCPAIYRLADPDGKTRLFVFAGTGPDGAMHSAQSEDDGRTGSDMRSLGLKCVMPFCAIAPIEGGRKLLGMTSIRRPNETKEERSNVVVQSVSADGGFTWTPWRIVLDLPGLKPCEPALVRSPDGQQWLCVMREKIIQRHLHFALGLIWFLQNDESVSPEKRAQFREWGLPKDEFPDNRHLPYEMYVREARRIVGRHVYTEHDNSLAPGLGRTPVQPDSVAITDWYMDSHACTTESRPGFHYDGKLILTEESRPGQIPYRSLLPQGVDNLLVPVCLSATHIAWGAIRLEPVWMQTGEAAGVAAALALRARTPPAQLDPDQLVRELCQRRFMVSFFNDVSVAWDEPWVAAAQYLGTKGFFHDYNARMGEPLKQATGKVWAEGLAKLLKGQLDANSLARAVAEAERSEKTMTESEFAALLSPSPQAADPPRRTARLQLRASPVITRGEAACLLWERLSQK